jgi:hypothetical protein
VDRKTAVNAPHTATTDSTNRRRRYDHRVTRPLADQNRCVS